MGVLAFAAHSTHLRPSTNRLTRTCKIVQRRRCARTPIRVAPIASVSLPASTWGVWATLIGAAVGGLAANRTRLGSALSPPIVTTLTTMVLANIGILPSAHPAYDLATKILVPFAIPCLLFNADLFRVVRDTGRLFPAFIVGTFATVISIVVAYHFVPLAPVFGISEGWKVAAALCARHIGGAINFVSAADSLNLSSSGITTALAADNVVLSAYFVLLFFLARGVNDPAVDRNGGIAVGSRALKSEQVLDDSRDADDIGTDETAGGKNNEEVIPMDDETRAERAKFNVEEVGIALTISAVVCAIGTRLSVYMPAAIGVIPTITLIALALSTTFPRILGRFARAGSSIGLLFMQLFFAACGASGSIVGVIKSAPMLFVFIMVHLFIHLSILMGVGSVIRLHRAELLVASNANVGGPATALAMAAAKDWKSLLIPALLIGVFGYSVATFIGIGVGHLFLKG